MQIQMLSWSVRIWRAFGLKCSETDCLIISVKQPNLWSYKKAKDKIQLKWGKCHSLVVFQGPEQNLIQNIQRNGDYAIQPQHQEIPTEEGPFLLNAKDF